VVITALGSIPWVGGVIAASAALHAAKEQSEAAQTIALFEL